MTEIPYVEKDPVSIVTVNTGQEAEAIRQTLEWFGYRVDLIWVGSRKEFIKVLSGEIKTEDTLILSVHGIEEGISMPEENTVEPSDIENKAKLKNKTVLNLGCDTGREEYVEAFKNSGVENYIAPGDYPEGNSALLFAIHFFYFLKKNESISKSFQKAKDFDEETKMFNLSN